MDVPPAMSCLFANTSSSASFISRSRMIRCSSCRASSIRERSVESMTKIRPWVPVAWLPLAFTFIDDVHWILSVRENVPEK